MIETARLTLRPPALDDLDAVHAMRSDPEVMRFIGGKPSSREEAWQRLLRNAGHWSLHGYGLFCVIERSTGRLIGEVGLMQAHRDLGDRFDTCPEAVWIFAKEAGGKGYATEAARASHDWFERSRPAPRTVCIINPDNSGSLNVAGKLGYRSFGTACYRDTSVTMLERVAGRGGL